MANGGGTIDFTSVGGQPVNPPRQGNQPGIDFSGVGGVPVSGGAAQQQTNADMDRQLHAAYDNRPLWRKVLGLDPDPATMPAPLKNYLGQQKQAATQQVAGALGDVAANYGQGAVQGLKTVPFMALGPAGGAVSEALGGGALGLAANLATQGLGSAAIASQEGATPTGTVTAGALGATAPALEAALPAMAPVLERAAATQYGRVLAPTTQANKYLTRTQVAPGLIERGATAVSLKGLAGQAAENVEKYGQMISDAWADLPQGTTTELQPMLDSLDQSAKDAFTVSSPQGPIPTSSYSANALDSVDGLKQVLTKAAEVNPQTGALEVPVDRLRSLRQAWDDIASQAKVYQGAQLADYAQGKLHAMAADSIREQLAEQFPSIDALNQEYSFWRNTQQVVNATLLRRMGQAKPLGQKLAAAAGTAGGYAFGGVGSAVLGREAMAALEKVTTSPAWGTVSAVAKDRLANAMAAGDTNTVIDMLTKVGAAEAAQPSQPGSMATAIAEKP